jgi:hypothetical protein
MLRAEIPHGAFFSLRYARGRCGKWRFTAQRKAKFVGI